MHRFPEVMTIDDLRLRPVVADDLPQITRQLSDPRVSRWLAAVAHPFGPEDAQEFHDHAQDPDARVRVIERDGVMTGCVCLGAGVWYWLDPPHWRQGVMQLVLRGAIGAYFAQPAPPLVATCRQDNEASLKLLWKLGFSRSPEPRRMFFRSTMSSHPCHDHALTAEQWHFLNPPRIPSDGICLRPARQKDAALLGQILPRPGAPVAGVWSASEPVALAGFIERHRYRGDGTGLFVVEDADRRAVGFVLRTAKDAPPEVLFSTEEEARRHGAAVADVHFTS